jgi:hypothetical protein
MYKYRLKKSKLNEADPKRIAFQNQRIDAFKAIESRLNSLYPAIDRAKDETIAFYKEKPESFAVVKPTDLIMDYLNDIEKLLNQ